MVDTAYTKLEREKVREQKRNNDVVYSLAINEVMYSSYPRFFDSTGFFNDGIFQNLRQSDENEDKFKFPRIKVANKAAIAHATQTLAFSPTNRAQTRLTTKPDPTERRLIMPEAKKRKTNLPSLRFEDLTKGKKVRVLWQRNEWYEGVVKDKDEKTFKVYYDDGETAIHDTTETFVVVQPWESEMARVEEGCNIKLYWEKERNWYFGKVTNKTCDTFVVTYKDGDEEEYDLSLIHI